MFCDRQTTNARLDATGKNNMSPLCGGGGGEGEDII